MAANDARANDPRSEASKKKDLISRGDYTPTPFGAYLPYLTYLSGISL